MFGAPSSCALHDLSGNPEETLEEELQPEQQREMFEEAKENHLGSERVGASRLETPTDELPSREEELAAEDGGEAVQEHSTTKDKERFLSDYSPDLHAAASPSAEHPSETLEEGVLLETNNSDAVEVDSKGVCGDEEKKSAVSRPELQKEADKEQTEEAPARSQGAPACGKKKKKKKRAKKKGVQEEEKQQANQDKCSEGKNTESAATGDVTEPVVDGPTDRAEDEQDRPEPEELERRNAAETCTPHEAVEESVVRDVKAETSETDKDAVQAPAAPEGFDLVPGGKSDELNLDVETVEAAAGVEVFETPRESRTEAKEEEPDGGPETVEALEPSEPSSDVKPSAESREEQQDEETPKTEERSEASSVPEESFGGSGGVVLNSDGVDEVGVPAVAERVSDCSHAESEKVEDAGEDGHAGEIQHNCTNTEAETSHCEACVQRDHSSSTTTKPSDGQDDTSTRDGSEPSSSSEPPSQPSTGADGQDEVSKEGEERTNDGEDGGEESSPPALEAQPTPAEELKVDLRAAEVPSEPCCSSGEEKSERLEADDAVSECEKSLEAAEQPEQLSHAEDQEFLCKDQTDEGFSDTTNTVNNPDPQPAEALCQCPGDEHEHGHSEEGPATLDSSEDKLNQAVTDGSEGQASAQESEDDDEVGQSFDFDDIDAEIAASSDPVEDEKCVFAGDPAAATVEGDASENPPEEAGTGVWAGVTENTNQAGSSPVEEGLDALQHLEGGDLVSESPDLVVQDAAPPQASKEAKKNGKKGKAKGKEDCKMS